jgi:hypothetical protein
MHLHANGIPMWTEDCLLACGHDRPIDDTPSADVDLDSTQPPDHIPLDGTEPSLIPSNANDECIMHQLSRDQLRLLWHHCLGHIHSGRVTKMHEAADGIPKVSIATKLDTCPVCAHAKLPKATRVQTSSRRARQCYQGISVNMGFMVQTSSKDGDCVK